MVVAILMLVALWRLGTPTHDTQDAASDTTRPTPLEPLTKLAEVLADNSIGRRASLENVQIREIPSARTLWVGGGGADRVFAVLDPDVKNSGQMALVAGARVTLIGLVRPSPKADVAMRQWSLDPDTAHTVEEGGTYLHVTEVRSAAGL